MEIVIVGAIIIFVLIYNNTIDKDKFFADNQKYLEALKEDDYQFLVYARYGEDVDVEQLFSQRVTYAFIAFLIVLALTISGNNSAEIINAQFFLNLVLSFALAAFVFKMPYFQLKIYYNGSASWLGNAFFEGFNNQDYDYGWKTNGVTNVYQMVRTKTSDEVKVPSSGGSNYVNTTYGSSTSLETGTQSGNGYVKIILISINN